MRLINLFFFSSFNIIIIRDGARKKKITRRRCTLCTCTVRSVRTVSGALKSSELYMPKRKNTNSVWRLTIFDLMIVCYGITSCYATVRTSAHRVRVPVIIVINRDKWDPNEFSDGIPLHSCVYKIKTKKSHFGSHPNAVVGNRHCRWVLHASSLRIACWTELVCVEKSETSMCQNSIMNKSTSTHRARDNKSQ